MTNELEKELTCTLCKKQQETHSEIVYSQGERVCISCKEVTQKADNLQFDLDMNRRITGVRHGNSIK